MRQKQVFSLNSAMLRREAGELLEQNANRLKLMEAILICTTPLMLYITLNTVYHTALLPTFSNPEVPGSAAAVALFYNGFLFLFSLLFTLPLLSGLLQLACKMEAEEEAALTDVFYAFSSPRAYGRALRISWCVLWRLSILVGVPGGLHQLISSVSEDSILVQILADLVVIALVFPLFYLLCGGFLKPFRILCKPQQYRRMRRHARSVGYRFWLGFLPWLLLSLLTICILLLADTLPRMLLSYFRLCRKLNEMTTLSED